MTVVGNTLYVANTDAIVAFPYSRGASRISARGQKIADLPAGPINHHWTKDVIASHDGERLFATVGSNSNVGEKGVQAEINRASVSRSTCRPSDLSLRLGGRRLRRSARVMEPQSAERIQGNLRALPKRQAGGPRDILTGFVNERGEALGRPVGVAVGKGGALLVADDVGNKIWRVVPKRRR